uniref:TEA domain-containing protein n=1 Tax=Acrobeloides nanus TaxID=290746 RepID=A0A914EB07_9BILA
MLAVRTRLPTIFETNEVEEMWPVDVENALLEAMVIYPPCGKKLIKHNNGEKYGRNHLIAYYIKKKCGKTRTPKQISSHMQFLMKKHKLISNLPLSNMNSQIFDKDMIDYKHSSDLVFIITQELNEQLFEVMDER